METMTPHPILLSAYAAKQCPVRVHNDFHPQIPKAVWEPPPELQARFDAGRAFESEVFTLLSALNPGTVLIDSDSGPLGAIDATVSAMAAGVPLILNSWLPDDADGGRKGRPDVLIRVGDGYLPADIKSHVTLKSAKKVTSTVSRPGTPAQRFELRGWSCAAKHRFADGMQLAHYTRMLQACGYHAGPGWGAVLGTSTVAAAPGEEPGLLFTWIPLDEPLYQTFSRSEGKKIRSLLERYDHEHGFRLKVADTALRIVGRPDDPEPLVAPIGQDECHQCPYGQWCADLMGPDDPSVAITEGRLTLREYRTLRRLGVETTAALSAVNLDDPDFSDEYFAEVSHYSRDEARRRLGKAIHRARMICGGEALERIGERPLHVPVADVEIDLDIESDTSNRVYMWGVRIRRGTDDATARYLTDFIEWEPLDSVRERELAGRFVAWLREQCAATRSRGQTIAVFHWTGYETAQLRSILGRDEIGDLLDPDHGIFVDLHKFFTANFFSVHGAKLKTVAPIFGFSWRVEDPGGSISQLYLSQVHGTTGDSHDPDIVAGAKRWLLSYNEDDTTATAKIRDGMRGWNG